MKACVIQPYYSFDIKDADMCFDKMTELLDSCGEDCDIIVLPEYCDVPTDVPSKKEFDECVKKYNKRIYEKASKAAKRCKAFVFANFSDNEGKGNINTTFAFDREGKEIGKYKKAHPAPSEVKTEEQGGNGLDCSYSYEYTTPYVIEAEGIRFGFMTCYDFYEYETFPRLARENVDVIIGCSHQRTDTHETLETIGKFLSYNTNAYLIRSSVSLGEESELCGCSMIVSPEGKMLVNMKSKIGKETYEIDIKQKHYKAAGYKGKPKAHFEYINEGRRPWLYRPSGSMMTPGDDELGYPRICAHRGFNTIAPENSLPAFGAAVALGADEIEFDIWSTKDGELVSLHDPTLDRVSDGTGNVWEHTYEELKTLDFGSCRDEHFKGLKIVKFEEILKKFAGTVIMNIHVKIWDSEFENPMYEKIAGLIRKYDCEKTVYMMTTSDKCSREFHQIAPEINRCVGFDGDGENMLKMVDRAIALGCKKIQLFKPYFTEETVKYAHENGILCNVFWSDDPREARDFIDMGIDTILTNDYLSIKNALKDI